MKTPIFYHPKQRVGHNFISVQKIPEFVRQSNRETLTFEPFKREDFLLAHSPKFVDEVLSCKIPNGFGTRDFEINEALHYSNASLWAAAENAMKYKTIACSASQGFHHAHFNSCGGYCTFNGLVIAAIKALKQVGKVLIIDGDAHFGDGTEDCLETLKLKDKIINVTRDEIGATNHSNFTKEEWGNFTRELLNRHQPGLVIYQAGADAWDEDPYRCGYLSMDGLKARDTGIFRAVKELKIPIAWNLAGGYTDPMQKTINVHLQTLDCSDIYL